MVKNGEKTKWADFLLWVNILLRFPPVYKTDYVGEAERQLANPVHYKRLEEPVFYTENKRIY